MKLYYAETLNPRKACAAAKYLNSPVEFVRLELLKGEHKQPAYLARNPNGKVPTLVVSDDLTIWEADAIMAYLARFAGSDLLPESDRQVEVMRWLSWGTQHFTRYTGALYFEYVIKPWGGFGETNPAAAAEATKQLRPNAAVLNEHLASRKYLVADRLTIADFSVAITLPYAKKAQIPLGDYPNIARWHDRLNELPAWREPFPHPVPDVLAA
ncbi:MAG: glutathione S-transferase family protein [Xanthobacteraceae bacterium]|nr:glutathione S-transferase family protein [Xanthobacteraceae bacterium]